MKNINKFMILVGILLNFSVVNAEVKEIESLDQISNEIVGGKTDKKVNKETKKEVVKNEVQKLMKILQISQKKVQQEQLIKIQ